VLGRDFFIRPSGSGAYEFCGSRLTLGGLRFSALGVHQSRNAALALEACSIAAPKFKGLLKPASLRRALEATLPPGRAELIGKNPAVLIDAAHTAESAAALAGVVETLDPAHKGTRVLIFAAMADKDMPAIFRAIERHFDVFIFTTARTERSESPENLAKTFRTISSKTALVSRTVEGAKEAALDVAGKGGFIAAAGSFYLAGILRKQNWTAGR
jgi:dihydrofolate synthase/folylpolyglutamate synthase